MALHFDKENSGQDTTLKGGAPLTGSLELPTGGFRRALIPLLLHCTQPPRATRVPIANSFFPHCLLHPVPKHHIPTTAPPKTPPAARPSNFCTPFPRTPRPTTNFQRPRITKTINKTAPPPLCIASDRLIKFPAFDSIFCSCFRSCGHMSRPSML